MNIANNTLIKQPQTAVTPKTGEFTYLANGEEVKLSPALVKKYLVSGDAQNVTDQEVMMFLTLCKYQHLNPFLREAYLCKYGNSPATIVTGKETFTKRADKKPTYLGKTAGIIVKTLSGEIEQREGTFYLPNEEIVGGWAKVMIKDRNPEYASVTFNEYAGRKNDGTLNKQWATKPATMIRKVAVVQALRDAFPNDFDEMYSPEEISMANESVDVNEIVKEGAAPVVIEEAPQMAPQAMPQAQAGKDTNVPTTSQAQPESVQSVLFG